MRWTEEERLRAAVRKLCKKLRGDAYVARKQKLICETCGKNATARKTAKDTLSRCAETFVQAGRPR